MTSDKQNTGYVAKPFTPALSASFHRSANKSPLTPKLATPTGYRTPKRYTPDYQHSSLTPAEPPALPSSSLSANVTPRSGSRMSRRDSPIPMPNTTPSNGRNSPQTPFVQASVVHGSNVGGYRADRSPVRAPGGKLEPSRTTRAKTLTTEGHHLSRPNSASEAHAGSPMFFHASDARSNPSEVDARPKLPAKAPSQTTFIYANGDHERQTLDRHNSDSSSYKRRSSGLSRSVVSAKPSASPRIMSPKLGYASPRLSDGLSSLPGSQIGSQLDSTSEVGSHVHSPSLNNLSPRPPPPQRHLKSSSLDSGAGATSPREALRPSPILISSPDSKVDTNGISSEHPGIGLGLRPRIFSNGSTASVDTYASAAQSPVKSESAGPAKDDPAVSARTERKILDLEISNSSLLAINRTLEREMRKQNAELRRFRRLSRSGRLSVAPTNRSVSGTSLSVMSEVDEGSELSSVRFPEEMSDFSDDEDEDSVPDDGVLSPDSLAQHDARHQAQDEKRFFVDLAKHQENLADSQKMNQSLKRCLGWTEELIREAKKALEYNVHINDIQLGGRVLTPEELNEINEEARMSPIGGPGPAFSESDFSEPETETP